MITASKKDGGAWTLTGTKTATVSNGIATFTNLGATNTASVTGAQLAFDAAGLSQVVSLAINLPAPPPDDDTPSSTPSPSNGVQVIINGDTVWPATAETEEVDGKTVTTVTIDDEKLEEKLNSEDNGSTVTIPVNNNSDVVVCRLNGQTIKTMETKETVLEIKTENVTFLIRIGFMTVSA